MKHIALCAFIVSLAVLGPRAANAQNNTAGAMEVNYAIDGTVTGLAAVGALLFTRVPVDTDKRWDSELLGSFDGRLRGQFSSHAAELSDALLVLTVASPALLQLERGIDEEAGQRALIYGEALSVNLLANAAAKYIVGRPRPYNYSEDPRVQAYANAAGKDSHTSFWSGHASTAFTSGVTGSYLFATGNDSESTRAAVWLLQMTLASTTAGLRVRAGKHFYSDVIVGAVIGSAIGYAVPALHASDAGVYVPSGLELGAIGGGVVLGSAISQLLPIKQDIAVPLRKRKLRLSNIAMVPASIDGGSGLALRGKFR